MNPIGLAFLGEFIRTVFEELALALRRRRRRKEEEAKEKKDWQDLLVRAHIEEIEYARHLAKLKQTSVIPENPYGE